MIVNDDSIYKFEDKEILITSPKVEDAAGFLEYLKKISGETEYLLRLPEEIKITVEKEEEILRGIIESEESIFVVAKHDDKIVGNLSFTRGTKFRTKHSGSIGIAMLEEYCGIGLGTELMRILFKWTDSNGIKRSELQVDSDNYRAIALYKKMGFKEEGLLKKHKYMEDGRYKDSIIMGRVID